MYEITDGVFTQLPIDSNVEYCSQLSLGNRTAVTQRYSSTTGNPGNPGQPGSSGNPDHPQFVFLMGTEGSGHHFWSTLIAQSPNYERLKQLKLLGATRNMTHLLFSRYQLDKSLFAGSPCHENWNSTVLLKQTARKLRFIGSKLPPNVTVPLNGLPTTLKLSGMISYPNFMSDDKCAGFRHPDVRLLQLACRDARVTCHFILQHRDPIATLRSTTRSRKFHSIGYAIALYTAMYTTLTLQLSTIAPSSALEFCWLYSDEYPSARLGTLLGYTTEEEFRTAFAEHYVPANATHVTKLIPPHQRVLLDTMLVAYEQLVSKCHDIQQSNG
jgi:hypothetical protein